MLVATQLTVAIDFHSIGKKNTMKVNGFCKLYESYMCVIVQRKNTESSRTVYTSHTQAVSAIWQMVQKNINVGLCNKGQLVRCVSKLPYTGHPGSRPAQSGASRT